MRSMARRALEATISGTFTSPRPVSRAVMTSARPVFFMSGQTSFGEALTKSFPGLSRRRG
jgi:hypothetical protein